MVGSLDDAKNAKRNFCLTTLYQIIQCIKWNLPCFWIFFSFLGWLFSFIYFVGEVYLNLCRKA